MVPNFAVRQSGTVKISSNLIIHLLMFLIIILLMFQINVVHANQALSCI